MTNNEKAASFIGWQPGPCSGKLEGPNKCNGDSRDSRYWIPEEGGFNISGIVYAIKHVPHEAIAPDMSQPENYMRALEAVVESKSYWSVVLDLTDKACSLEADPMPIKKPVRDIRCDGETIAEAVIKTLAALWDAEHK